MDYHKIIKNYLIKEIIKDEDITIENDELLITGGLIDSFALVELVVFLEKEFNTKIDNTKATVKNMDTINSIVKVLGECKNGKK